MYYLIFHDRDGREVVAKKPSGDARAFTWNEAQYWAKRVNELDSSAEVPGGFKTGLTAYVTMPGYRSHLDYGG